MRITSSRPAQVLRGGAVIDTIRQCLPMGLCTENIHHQGISNICMAQMTAGLGCVGHIYKSLLLLEL